MERRARLKRRSGESTKVKHQGEPSVFTCPDCQGTLFSLRDGGMIRFQCRIGHLYSPESMLEAQDDNVERLMWSATRALEEQAEYISQMADQIAKASDQPTADGYAAKSRSAMEKARKLRLLLDTDLTLPNGRIARSAQSR